jgi:hypothetical protein
MADSRVQRKLNVRSRPRADIVFDLQSHQSDEMMWFCVTRAVSLGLLLAWSPELQASAGDQLSVSLVEARLSHVEDITGEPGAPCFCDENGHNVIDGSFQLTFTPIRTLSGRALHHSISMKQASAEPVPGFRYYLLVTHSNAGDAIEWKGPVRDGLCLDPSDADRYGLATVLRRYPCEQL